MVNVEVSILLKDGKVVKRQLDLTDDGFVELQRIDEADRKKMICALVGFEAVNIDRVELKMEEGE
ncbi:MAG: hypothetical protein MJZ37_08640 [Bacilli bacterium]|nr:hypothetical protein [Bacilli bacterium]